MHARDNQDESPHALTIYQTADRLNVSPRTVWTWISEGRLRCLRLGPRTTRVPVEALNEFLRRCAEES